MKLKREGPQFSVIYKAGHSLAMQFCLGGGGGRGGENKEVFPGERGAVSEVRG